jgi:hypothetical protein
MFRKVGLLGVAAVVVFVVGLRSAQQVSQTVTQWPDSTVQTSTMTTTDWSLGLKLRLRS